MVQRARDNLDTLYFIMQTKPHINFESNTYSDSNPILFTITIAQTESLLSAHDVNSKAPTQPAGVSNWAITNVKLVCLIHIRPDTRDHQP